MRLHNLDTKFRGYDVWMVTRGLYRKRYVCVYLDAPPEHSQCDCRVLRLSGDGSLEDTGVNLAGLLRWRVRRLVRLRIRRPLWCDVRDLPTARLLK